MPRSRRSNFRQSSGPRRQTEWLFREFVAAPTVLDGQTFVFDSSMDATELAKLPFTITRTIGLLTVFSDQAVLTQNPHGAFGALVVSEKAATLGPTAFPDPVTEGNSDEWFLYGQWDATIFVDAGGSAGFGGIQQIAFDSKAQRKVEEGQQIAFLIANAASVVDDAQYIWQYRMLIKLH